MLVVLESGVFRGLAEESGESLSFIFAEAAALLLDRPPEIGLAPVWERCRRDTAVTLSRGA